MPKISIERRDGTRIEVLEVPEHLASQFVAALSQDMLPPRSVKLKETQQALQRAYSRVENLDPELEKAIVEAIHVFEGPL